MSIGGKIRFLLLLLGICCIITALSLNNSITKSDLLAHEAEELQQNLDVKQQLVQNYLSSPEKIIELKRLNKNDKLALNFIATYRENGINVLVYKNEKLEFWSSAKAFPTNISLIKEGSSLKQLSNGYYELIKKTVDDYVFIFLISLKSQYSIENQYLKNQISPELFSRNTLDLGTFTDKDVQEIFSLNKDYLFTVKLTDEVSKNMYADIQLWLWIVGLLSICAFVNSYCSWLAKRGFALSATLVLTLFFAGVRLSDLQFFWFNHQFNLSIFSPYVYAQGEFLPSLGDLFLHVIALTWIGFFAYVHRHEYVLPKWMIKSKIVGLTYHFLILVGLALAAFLFDEIFFGLINNSKINLDITNIISLGWISWISILTLCLAWFNVYLFSNVTIEVSKQLNVTNRERLIVFLTLLTGLFIYKLIDDFNVFFLVYALLIFIIGWNNYIQFRKFSVGIFALLFLCMAFLTSIKYTKFGSIKEHENRRAIAEKLLNADDPKVINSIESFEKGVSSDSSIVKYFKSPMVMQSFSFHNYVTKTYLDGYLSRFEYKMYEYNNLGTALKINEQLIPLSKYKNLVTSGAIKTQENSFSYRINDTFGFQIYFGIIPIFEGTNLLGTLVIELKSQPYDYNSHFPDLLIDGKLKSDEDFTDYSIAFYKDNKLYAQSGKYTYAMVNTRFKGEIGKVEFVNDEEKDVTNVGGTDGASYNHATYRPDNSKLIVISREKVPYLERLATLSFFFLVFILFGIAVYILIFIIKNISGNTSGWFNLNRYLMINANKILYKTRIQVSIVLSVVATLLIVGWATFFYIRKEYQTQQENTIREKIRKVQLAYEKQILNTGSIRNDDETQFEFNQFADVNSAFLNLYDIDGNLWLTSLPKMFDLGIVGKKIGPKAFIELSLMQRSEFLNTAEKIGTFQYAAAYAPIRNAQNKTIAYIGMPYYANESDYQAKIGLFINTLINIYALVFVLIGVLAVFLANQITNPLTFIQENIRKTKLGQKNRPIVWHRQDEIGALVKEYNKMIAALELSATKLARSERESAWREMAKQVAHEIKNPLTPLKLGVQLLEKSWKEGDPNFEKKFASFNKSFIEQIDSLATIASEFSNFAKMPDTKLEELELLPIIEQTIGVFNTAENVEILVLNRTNKKITVLGDKDQLLRTFNNLLKNAIEASEGKEKCIIKIHLLNDEKNVFVEVQDNGKGIEAILKDKIFVPNFTTKSSGTGLGLAFVKQAIENAGGTVDFTSEINMGTTFNLIFPLV
ncbi:sensor histidine kinase [Pedobacter frigiditerrae]|uniref:sensor histidine kinase n=1 Tax=Pedobacter frigiditerrae TaxID=2530452 RepID=UPI001CEC3087|nr:ATP-binding protein [Pedobacter frigiditerrae]